MPENCVKMQEYYWLSIYVPVYMNNSVLGVYNSTYE